MGQLLAYSWLYCTPWLTLLLRITSAVVKELCEDLPYRWGPWLQESLPFQLCLWHFSTLFCSGCPRTRRWSSELACLRPRSWLRSARTDNHSPFVVDLGVVCSVNGCSSLRGTTRSSLSPFLLLLWWMMNGRRCGGSGIYIPSGHVYGCTMHCAELRQQC